MQDPAFQENRSIPDVKILVSGNELELEVDADIMEIIVCDYATGASWFSVQLNNWHSDQQEFKYIDDILFREGLGLEVQLGYDNDIISLYKGEITTYEPEFNRDEAPTIKILGYDSLHRFRRGRKTKSFLEMKDSDIARQIASNLGLGAQVEDTEVTHAYLLQNNQSDIDFLLERAQRIRYEVVIEGGKLHFRKAANNKDRVMMLEYGQSLQSFYPRLSTISQVSKIVVRGWDPIAKKPIKGEAASGDEVSKMRGSRLGAAITESAFFKTESIIVDKPIFSEGEANQIAKGKFNDMAVNFITGEGTTVGNPGILAGSVLELTGLGEKFSGSYYVASVKHVINPKGYSTQFTVERNAT